MVKISRNSRKFYSSKNKFLRKIFILIEKIVRDDVKFSSFKSGCKCEWIYILSRFEESNEGGK